MQFAAKVRRKAHTDLWSEATGDGGFAGGKGFKVCEIKVIALIMQ
jgi:hypothetical protein